jgi:hypothetical protein
MWRNTPAPGDLREQHPEVALTLDTEFLSADLKRLGIQHIRRYRRKSAVIEMVMLPHHLMRIAPVDKGANGYGEWTTWYWTSGDEETQPELRSSIRAHIEIIDMKATDEQPCASFTSHNDDIEALVRNAILGMRHITGVKIEPVVIRRKTR